MTSTPAHLQAFSRLLARDPDTRELNMRHLQLLAHCAAIDRTTTVGEIATATGLSPSGASRAVVRLAGLALLDRLRAEDDQRQVLVRITAKGRELDDRVRHNFEATKKAARNGRHVAA